VNGTRAAGRTFREAAAFIDYDRRWSRVVGSLDRYSNCPGHKDEDEDKMNLRGLSRRSSAFDEAVPADVLSAALYDRFRSYEEHTFAQKVLSPTRQGFDGHNEAKSHGSIRMVDKA
jgi:hypothetical protein